MGLEKQLPRLDIAAANIGSKSRSRAQITLLLPNIKGSQPCFFICLNNVSLWSGTPRTSKGQAGEERRCRWWCVALCSPPMLHGWNATRGQENTISTSYWNLEKESRQNGFTQPLNQQVFLERQPHAHAPAGHWRKREGERAEEVVGRGAACLGARDLAWSPPWVHCLQDLGHTVLTLCILFFSSGSIRPLFPSIYH